MWGWRRDGRGGDGGGRDGGGRASEAPLQGGAAETDRQRQSGGGARVAVTGQQSGGSGVAAAVRLRRIHEAAEAGGSADMEPRTRLHPGRTASSQSCGGEGKMGKSAPVRRSCGAGGWGGIAAERKPWWQSHGGRAKEAELRRQSQRGRVTERPQRRGGGAGAAELGQRSRGGEADYDSQRSVARWMATRAATQLSIVVAKASTAMLDSRVRETSNATAIWCSRLF